MPKYATIDMHSGYVWWAGNAMHPVEACQESEREGMSEARDFVAYAVYEIPASLDITDGQDQDQIAAVMAARFVCYCAPI